MNSAPARGGQIDASIWRFASQARRSDFLAEGDVSGEFEQSDVVVLLVGPVVGVQNHFVHGVVHWTGAIVFSREVVFAKPHHAQTSLPMQIHKIAFVNAKTSSCTKNT